METTSQEAWSALETTSGLAVLKAVCLESVVSVVKWLNTQVPDIIMICGKKGGLVWILVVCILVLLVTAVLYSVVPISYTYFKPAISVITVTEFQKCTRYENVSLPRDVVVRAVYFDGRPRQGGHRNSSVFLVEVRIAILKQKGIVGCAVGGNTATIFGIRQLGINYWVHSHHPELTHDTVIVDCFDLPAKNGSTAYIMYRRHPNASEVTCVDSEYPLIIPEQPKPAHPHWNFTVAVCTAVLYGKPPLLTEWIQYQRTLSADHVHIMAEDSFVKAGGFQNEALKQAIEEGFVSVDVWKQRLNRRQVYYHSQALAHEACLYRLLGTYSYIMLVDLDEFFITRVPGQTSLHYYAKQCCDFHTTCGSCHFREFMFFPDCGLNGTIGSDGNITAKLVSYVNIEQKAVGKSIHIPPAIWDVGCQRAEVFVKGYRRREFPMEGAYVAHIRTGRKPPQQKC